MEWTTIIVAIIGALAGGGLTALLTLRERKKGAQLENKEKEDGRWERLADQLESQIGNLNEQIVTLNERLDKKDARITELEDANASLRMKLDDANTNYVKANLLKCTTLACADRKPPLGFTELTPEEMLRERRKFAEENLE